MKINHYNRNLRTIFIVVFLIFIFNLVVLLHYEFIKSTQHQVNLINGYILAFIITVIAGCIAEDHFPKP